MQILDVTELKYTADGNIDVLLDTEEFGVIPFTVSILDETEYSKQLYKEILSGKFGEVQEYSVSTIDLELKWSNIRSTRNILLQHSDWTQLPDVPLATKEAWVAYRQALRDVTLQPDPFNITWPQPPQ